MKGLMIPLLALVVPAGQTSEPSALQVQSYKTAFGAVIVALSTKDRGDFYELLARMGESDKYRYSVEWSPRYRLSVSFMPTGGSGENLDTDQCTHQLLSTVNMSTDGNTVSFAGKRMLAQVPTATAEGSRVTLPTIEDAPALVVLAAVAETQKRDYTVTQVHVGPIPTIGLDGTDADQFFTFFGRAAYLDVTITPTHLEIKGRCKGT